MEELISMAGTIRTLVIEDDPAGAEINIRYLKRMPEFTPIAVVATVSDAIAVLDRQQVDLVLLDFQLPAANGAVMEGTDACRVLRAARTRPVDIIAITADMRGEVIHDAFAYGVVQYVIKPFSFATFRDKLDRYATYRRLLRHGPITQVEIDEVLSNLRCDAAENLPPNYSKDTYVLIGHTLRKAVRPMPAKEIAEATHVSRECAGRYLNLMHNHGVVTIVPVRGNRGRPTHLYQWRDQ